MDLNPHTTAQGNPEPSPTSHLASSPRKWRRRLLGLAVFCFLLSAFCFVCRAPLLRAVANAWLVNEPPLKADAIIILGGGAQFRSFEAARLYQQGLAPRVLVMNSELRSTDREELTIPDQELVRRTLLRKGVPASAIEIAGTNLTSTFEEALTTREWVKATGARTLLIPTGAFQARRARWVFHKGLRGTGVEVRVLAIGPEECDRWWKTEATLIDFQNEVIKYGFYRIKY